MNRCRSADNGGSGSLSTPGGPGEEKRLISPESDRLLEGKRRTASAGGGGIGVVNYESRPLEVFLVVNLGTDQILETQRVHHQSHAVFLENCVVVLRFFIEAETVLKTRTAPALNVDAKQSRMPTLFGNQLLNLAGRVGGQLDGV